MSKLDPDEFPIPETRVLAVASHVVSGNVGNKVAVFVLQLLGCDVAALNTVNFSNHTGYGRWTGTKVAADEIWDLYEGMQQSRLDDADMMLSGYVPSAAAVEAVGRIGRDLRGKKMRRRVDGGGGGFFWVLDPAMGDNGRLYVALEVVAAYKAVVPHVDLIVPNQFEAELLSGVAITDVASAARAVQALHDTYGVPHVVITSVRLGPGPAGGDAAAAVGAARGAAAAGLSVVGSTMRRSDGRARPFRIDFPVIDCYFVGTGDMFGALTVVRMREAAAAAGLLDESSWVSADAVGPAELPLAKAVEKVLGSMHRVLVATKNAMDGAEAEREGEGAGAERGGGEAEGADRERGGKGEKEDAATRRVVMARAAEIRLVRNTGFLRRPEVLFTAEPIGWPA